MVKVFIDRTGEEKEINFSGRIIDLISKLKINPETIVVVKNGKVTTEDDMAKEQDEIKLISVVSGG